MPQRFTDLAARIESELRPATALEQWFASEIAHAGWELERVRANKSNGEAEAFLNAAYGRASRNWNRARKELQTLQSARMNHFVILQKRNRPAAADFPLADPGRAPLPKKEAY